MSAGLLLWTEVVCDECADSTCGEYVSGGKRSLRPLIKELRQKGWLVAGGKVYCRTCKPKTKGA